jgi:hypothetical protein
VPRLSTSAGRDLAEARYDRLERFVGALAAEVGQRRAGDGLGVLDYLIDNRLSPRMSTQVAYLRSRLDGRADLAGEFVLAMEQEMNGLL